MTSSSLFCTHTTDCLVPNFSSVSIMKPWLPHAKLWLITSPDICPNTVTVMLTGSTSRWIQFSHLANTITIWRTPLRKSTPYAAILEVGLFLMENCLLPGPKHPHPQPKIRCGPPAGRCSVKELRIGIIPVLYQDRRSGLRLPMLFLRKRMNGCVEYTISIYPTT